VLRFVVTAICDGLSSSGLSDVLQRALGAALDGPECLVGVTSQPPVAEAIVVLHGAEPRVRAGALRRALAGAPACSGLGVDLAVRLESARVPPRLLVMDIDSTLITIEVIDELARLHGVGAEVAAVTERAMRGELDFEAALRTRVSKLAGLSASALERVAETLVLSEGAARLIAALEADGAAVAIASGGFTFAADALSRRLGLIAAYANQLEVVDGIVTGRVAGDVITAERKAAIVRELMAARGVSMEQTIAIGDGANDRLMLAAAGFGVAFRAKPALAAVADATIDHGGLDRVLAFCGRR
jgi:phosphoserine phosphatase